MLSVQISPQTASHTSLIASEHHHCPPQDPPIPASPTNIDNELPTKQTLPSTTTPNLDEMTSTEAHPEPTSYFTHPPTEDFDPSRTLDPCSPFYLYRHESPRPSIEQFKADAAAAVSVQELDPERGGSLTPYATSSPPPRLSSEKTLCAAQSTSKGQTFLARLNPWTRPGLQRKKSQCMTRPEQKWTAKLSKRQKLGLKLLIAFLVAGALVGTVVGIAVRTHSGVYRSQNGQSSIGGR